MFIKKIRRFIFFRITVKSKKERMDLFFKKIKVKSDERILDVGAGGGELWSEFSCCNDLNITGLDVKKNDSKVYKNFITGDGRKLPFPDNSFDIVFSNSVLEHVGDFEQQKLMAKEIIRVGKKYFVQVPNRHFPIEPHYFIPFLQYLPKKYQKHITGILFGESEEIHLPTKKQLRLLFPDAEIMSEKFFGLTKSFYIFRG